MHSWKDWVALTIIMTVSGFLIAVALVGTMLVLFDNLVFGLFLVGIFVVMILFLWAANRCDKHW